MPVADPRGREREVTQRVAGLCLRGEQPGEAVAGLLPLAADAVALGARSALSNRVTSCTCIIA